MSFFASTISRQSALAEALRALPSFDPPPGGWLDLQRRQRARRRRWMQTGAGGFAVAASLMLMFALPWQPGSEPQIAAPTEQSQVAQLIGRSAFLEQRLASARPQVRRWNGAQAMQVARLQRNLATIDDQINAAPPGESSALWQRRVELMSTLVAMHENPSPALVRAAYQY